MNALTLVLLAAAAQCPGGVCARPAAPVAYYAAPAPVLTYRPAYAAPVYYYAAPAAGTCANGVCAAPTRRRRVSPALRGGG